MIINKAQENGKLILSLEGRLDADSALQLQEILIPAIKDLKQIELDFSQLAYISSAGLRVLLLGQRTADAKKTTMTVGGVSKEVMKVFEITGFDDVLSFV